MARYISEVHLQDFHRQKDPILLRLEEKKRLRALMDAAWHAMEFPSAATSLSGTRLHPRSQGRPPGALDDLHDYLDEAGGVS